MDIREDKAYAYWAFLNKLKWIDELWSERIILYESYEQRIELARRHLVIEEPSDVLKDAGYQAALESAYGLNAESCPIPAIQAKYRTRQNANINPEYCCFTEIVKRSVTNTAPSYALQCWLRDRRTIMFLTLWEKKHNPDFRSEDAENLVLELQHANTSMTLKKWIERTSATGIVSLPGRYGGTYAAPVIAMEFHMWLSPEYHYSVVDGYYFGKHHHRKDPF